MTTSTLRRVQIGDTNLDMLWILMRAVLQSCGFGFCGFAVPWRRL